MMTIGQATLKKWFFCLFEIIYIVGSIGVTFVPWVLMIYSLKLYPKLPETVDIPYILKGFAVWVLVPLVGFALLLEIYVKRIKRVSRRLKKYGFLGKGIYKKAEKESTEGVF